MGKLNLAIFLLMSLASWTHASDEKDDCKKRIRPLDPSWHKRYINHGPGKACNLSDAEQKRIRVEWNESRVESDRWGSRLIISGRVRIEPEDGSEIRPMDWAQPVTVVLARQPDDPPDWSDGYGDEDSNWSSNYGDETSQWSDVLVNWRPGRFGTSDSLFRTGKRGDGPKRTTDGSFRASFPLPRFRRPVGATKPYQVGLPVGRIAYWSSLIPVLPQSISMLNITGPPRLSPTLQLINGTPSPGGELYDPVALIRAVNHLRSLEKPQAIAGFRGFLTFANHWSVADWEPRDPENSDTSDEDCLELLIPLVFERVDPSEKLPAGGPGLSGRLLLEKIKNGEPLPTRLPKPEKSYTLIEEEWSIREITIWNGIPFQTSSYVRGGLEAILEGPRIPATTYLVDWTEDRAKLIAGRLRPADNPLAATDEIFNELATNRNLEQESEWERDKLRSHLHIQAWRMVAHLVEPERKKPRDRFDELFDSEERWAQLKQKRNNWVFDGRKSGRSTSRVNRSNPRGQHV